MYVLICKKGINFIYLCNDRNINEIQRKNHQALFFIEKNNCSLEAEDLRLSNVTGSYVRDIMSNGQCKKNSLFCFTLGCKFISNCTP